MKKLFLLFTLALFIFPSCKIKKEDFCIKPTNPKVVKPAKKVNPTRLNANGDEHGFVVTYFDNGKSSIVYITSYNSVDISINVNGKDQIRVEDSNISDKNGVDVFKNHTKKINCYRDGYFPKGYKGIHLCSKKVLEVANNLFKRMMKKLEFKKWYEKYIKPSRTDENYLDGWK